MRTFLKILYEFLNKTLISGKSVPGVVSATCGFIFLNERTANLGWIFSSGLASTDTI
jgi:hypothetical protein